MDANEVAHELIRLGNRESVLLEKLAKVAAKRCELLRQVATDHGGDLGLDPPSVSASVAPKDRDEDE